MASQLKRYRHATQRLHTLFIRKLSKAIDLKNIQIADLQAKVQSLETIIRRMRPKKRMKVKAEPNKQFVSMLQVKRAQAFMRAKMKKKEAPELIEFKGFE
jgi:hypothetical protein